MAKRQQILRSVSCPIFESGEDLLYIELAIYESVIQFKLCVVQSLKRDTRKGLVVSEMTRHFEKLRTL